MQQPQQHQQQSQQKLSNIAGIAITAHFMCRHAIPPMALSMRAVMPWPARSTHCMLDRGSTHIDVMKLEDVMDGNGPVEGALCVVNRPQLATEPH
eukprot:2966644-Amphidinium_carterae.1